MTCLPNLLQWCLFQSVSGKPEHYVEAPLRETDGEKGAKSPITTCRESGGDRRSCEGPHGWNIHIQGKGVATYGCVKGICNVGFILWWHRIPHDFLCPEMPMVLAKWTNSSLKNTFMPIVMFLREMSCLLNQGEAFITNLQNKVKLPSVSQRAQKFSAST